MMKETKNQKHTGISSKISTNERFFSLNLQVKTMNVEFSMLLSFSLKSQRDSSRNEEEPRAVEEKAQRMCWHTSLQ